MNTAPLVLHAPLFTDWSEQYVRLHIPGLTPGSAHALQMDGKPAEFQYTGNTTNAGAEILVCLGFKKGQSHSLQFVPTATSSTDLTPTLWPATSAAKFGTAGKSLQFSHHPLGLFENFAGYPLRSHIQHAPNLTSRILRRTNHGPLFTDYQVQYLAGDDVRYTVQLRCYHQDPYIQVAENFHLGMTAQLHITLNPDSRFNKILSHQPVDFEADSQPFVEDLNLDRPYDLICRLQMPQMGEYFVPTRRKWFALFDDKHPAPEMFGILALQGEKWTNPVANMMSLYAAAGKTEFRSSLDSGERHWLLYTGPLQKQFTPEQPHIFNRLNAQFSNLRLDEHLDLSGQTPYDTQCWNAPGFFGENFRERARQNAAVLLPLKKAAANPVDLSVQALLHPSPATYQPVLDRMTARFEKWVRQYQGIREAKSDYNVSVIGFARTLRILMIDYELLRKDRFLTDNQINQLNAYFVFAARRILDEGRWPHSRSWIHPDHPESTRDIYTYPGEHRPDMLIWTNCLPNFQSDPICALLHLSALIPEHPDSLHWQNFAIDDLERQLTGYLSASGAWEESINYTLYSFSYFVTTFRILKNRCGINYFQDARIRAIADWLVRFFGPYDKRFDAYTYPGIGNAVLPQQYCECLLSYASELDENDPLRADLIAIYQKTEHFLHSTEHRPVLLATTIIPDRQYPIRPLTSEHMDQLGVSMRHSHPSPAESFLFQKIGFFKDHYEADETALNWFAKGKPLCMEYGTYSGDAGAAASHNVVEIPDADPLRRGYLADKYFSPLVDYTRCEVPITLKLSWGHTRTFAEIDGPPVKPTFFYLGEPNPVGPKTWKSRSLLFVKPDYILLFDRVFGNVEHRYNLHAVSEDFHRDSNTIRAKGRFDLDLLCFVQHPAQFKFESGDFQPAPSRYGEGEANLHRQKFCRIYNPTDGLYRTLLFAQEPNRQVKIEPAGTTGLHVTTPEYEDYIFLSDEVVTEKTDHFQFRGRAGWIRRESSGQILASVPDGDLIAAFGLQLQGRGPYHHNTNHDGKTITQGVPREIHVTRS